MDNLIEQMLTIELGYVAMGIVAVLWTIGKIPIGNIVDVTDDKGSLQGTVNLANRTVRDSHLWRNVLPVLPCVLGPVAYLTIPMGIDAQWGTKLLMGLFAGLVAAHGRKIIKRIIVDKIGPSKGE